MALNLVMFGPPGAGKGTQASQLSLARGIPQVSTGDILREAWQARTELGCRAKAVMDEGELVSDEVMVGIVRERLTQDDVVDGFILDGFPRTVAQASALDEILVGRAALVVVELAVPDEKLVGRLSKRKICAGCGAIVGSRPDDSAIEPTKSSLTCSACGGELVQRNDDREEVVRERLRVYQQQTAPLVEFYKCRPSFHSVNGNQSPEFVARDVDAAIDAMIGTTA